MSEIIFTNKSMDQVLRESSVVEVDETSLARGRTSREILNRLLVDLEIKGNHKKDFYKDLLRSLLSQLKLTHFDDKGDSVEVKLHHGRPDRATAKKFHENNIILPYMTVSLTRVETGKLGGRTNDTIVDYSWWNNSTNRAERIISRPDIPVKLNYTLSLWTKYISDMESLSEALRSKFLPAMLLRTRESNQIKAFLSSETDISKLEVADKEDRVIQKTFNISLECFIPSPKYKITSTGKIEQFNAEIGLDEKS